MFSRFVTTDVDFYGTPIPAGAVMHLCLAAGNRDPSRWDDPDRFDPFRPLNSHLGFGNGRHICLGLHVARAEIATAVGAALDRLPNLRLDPDGEAPRIIGMYERGPTSVPVRVLRAAPFPRRSLPLTPSQRASTGGARTRPGVRTLD